MLRRANLHEIRRRAPDERRRRSCSWRQQCHDQGRTRRADCGHGRRRNASGRKLLLATGVVDQGEYTTLEGYLEAVVASLVPARNEASLGLVDGAAAGAATTATILSSAHFGFGLSTTHVSTGSILGSGVGRDTRMPDIRVGLASAGMGLGVWLASELMQEIVSAASLMGQVVQVGIPVTVGVALYLGLALLFKVEELEMVSRASWSSGSEIFSRSESSASVGALPSSAMAAARHHRIPWVLTIHASLTHTVVLSGARGALLAAGAARRIQRDCASGQPIKS